jgi:hypothetical protein
MASFVALTPPLGQQPWGPVSLILPVANPNISTNVANANNLPVVALTANIGLEDFGYPAVNSFYRTLILSKYPGFIFANPNQLDGSYTPFILLPLLSHPKNHELRFNYRLRRVSGQNYGLLHFQNRSELIETPTVLPCPDPSPTHIQDTWAKYEEVLGDCESYRVNLSSDIERELSIWLAGKSTTPLTLFLLLRLNI